MTQQDSSAVARSMASRGFLVRASLLKSGRLLKGPFSRFEDAADRRLDEVWLIEAVKG